MSGLLYAQLSVVYFLEHDSNISPLPIVLESKIYSGQWNTDFHNKTLPFILPGAPQVVSDKKEAYTSQSNDQLPWICVIGTRSYRPQMILNLAHRIYNYRSWIHSFQNTKYDFFKIPVPTILGSW